MTGNQIQNGLPPDGVQGSRVEMRTVPLNVAGQRITLRTDHSESYMRELADEVNALVNSLKQGAPSAAQLQIMALAALQLMDRVAMAEDAAKRMELKMDKHIGRLEEVLRSLGEGDGLEEI